MRGSPLLRALLAFCLIASLGWPLWHLTHTAEAVPMPPSVPPAQPAKAIGLQLDFTQVPKRFVVKHLDQEIWSEAMPQAAMERQVTMEYPESGVDLVFQIEWPEGEALCAARVRLTDPAGDAHEKSIWGRGTMDEALTFP